MSSELNISSLLVSSIETSSIITIQATVCSGFEQEALLECIDTFGDDLNSFKTRGRICFNVDVDKYSLVKKLRSVDNLLLTVNHFTITVSEDDANKESDLNVVKQLVDEINWEKYITVWASILAYEGVIFPTRDQYLTAVNKFSANSKTDTDKSTEEKLIVNNCTASTIYNEYENEDCVIHQNNDANEKSKKSNHSEVNRLLKYRVTCNRSGKHSFSSQEAAHCFGGLLQDRYNWIVDLDNYDLEVILKIVDNAATVSLALTESSLHRRNITHFGLTTLRATVSHNMLRLAKISTGDIVMDPMCGSGSIPIEGALSFPGTFHICGDIHKKSVKLTRMNIESLNSKPVTTKPLLIDVFKWDASSLPLKAESVDVVVTDLPFGKRVGSKANNRVLYYDVLKELSRVVKPVTGRAVFLTTNRNTFTMVYSRLNEYWKQKTMLVINMGGLRGFVYLLLRTSNRIK